MKKIGLIISAIVLLITSCADKETYTLTGKIIGEDLNGKNVYLQEPKEDGNGYNILDTAQIVNGAFVFKGKASEMPTVKFVAIADVPEKYPEMSLFIAENGKINMTIDTTSSYVEGTPANDEYQRFATASDEVNGKLRAIGTQYRELTTKDELTPEKEEELNAQYEGYTKELLGVLYEYAKKNIQNPVGEFFFRNYVRVMSEEQQRELLTLVNPKLKELPDIQQLEKHLQVLESSAVGKTFIDVKGKTPEGKDVSLSEYAGKGKVVLIDFWASWCGPCIREMPTVIEAYSKYKDKGFEIVGISLDEDADAWKKAIKDLKITWPQMSDLKAWKSDLAAPYGVNFIPYTILLDKDGRIIEKNLRGKQLISKLDELLK